jgi:hypothetical protein
MSAPKMRGIAFSPIMVRALQTGSKTQTRRMQKGDKPPYNVGEILYIKERHRVIEFSPEWCDIQYGESGEICRCYYDEADYKALQQRKPLKSGRSWGRWMPGRYMRKNFHRSRICVTGVRSELLWNITREDALAEGITKDEKTGFYPDYTGKTIGCATPELSFISLFALINGSDAIKAEQRVWVIEFEKVL